MKVGDIAFVQRDERQQFDKLERSALVGLGYRSLAWNQGRQIPREYVTLIAQGLAFRSHYYISRTPKGDEVADRC